VEKGFDLVHFGGIFYSYQGSPLGSINLHFSPLFSGEFIGWVRMGSGDDIIAWPRLYSICFFYIVGMWVAYSIGGSIIVYVSMCITIVFCVISLFLICF